MSTHSAFNMPGKRIVNTRRLLIGVVWILSYIHSLQAMKCTECLSDIQPFFDNLTTLYPGETAQDIGSRQCRSSSQIINCLYGCEMENGTAYNSLDYIYTGTAEDSEEYTLTYTAYEWWSINCDPACRMADLLYCENYTQSASGDCQDFQQWRQCVDTVSAEYSCDTGTFCTGTERWYHGYRMHHEIACTDTTDSCVTEMQQCYHTQFGYSDVASEDPNYVMSWEFFYANTPNDDRLSRCQSYERAELCFNQTQCASAADQEDINRVRDLMRSGYSRYCNRNLTLNEICGTQGVTEPTSSSSTTTESSATNNVVVSEAPSALSIEGSCTSCDEAALTMMTYSNNYQGFNRTWFGQGTCRNYTSAFDCYKNCSIDGTYENLVDQVTFDNKTEGQLALGVQRYELMSLIRTQLIISCNPTCRHADLWVCENHYGDEDVCQQDVYESWLSCYEEGIAEQEDCGRACSVAQRRVNSFKAIRQIGCAVSSLGDLCGRAVIRCTHEMYSYKFNLERFLTVNLNSNRTCDFFMFGTKCLLGEITAFGPADNPLTINDVCTTDSEQATLTTLATEWRSLYHHEECERLVEDMTYQDICDAEDIISPNTTSSSTTPPTTPTDAPGCVNTTGSDQSCMTYEGDATCDNPCRGMTTDYCDTRQEALACRAAHSSTAGCTTLCSEGERSNTLNEILSYITCEVPAEDPEETGSDIDVCKVILRTECVGRYMASPTGEPYEKFVNPAGDLQSWCSAVHNMTECFYNATFSSEVQFLTETYNRPCGLELSRQLALTELILLVKNKTSEICPTNGGISSWAEVCPTTSETNSSVDVVADESGEDTGVTAEERPQEECLTTFAWNNGIACDLHHNIEDCETGLSGWMRCMEDEAGNCSGICTPSSREQFIKAIRGQLRCSLNTTTICAPFATSCVDNTHLFTRLETDSEAEDVCQQLVDVRSCLNDSIHGSLTVSGSTVERVCSSEATAIQQFMDKVTAFYTDVGCSADTTNTWDNLCPNGHLLRESVDDIFILDFTKSGADDNQSGSGHLGSSTQPANYLYNITGVADDCPTCQSMYSDLSSITCSELSALATCLDDFTTNCPTADLQQQIENNAKTQQLLKKVCDPVCPMNNAKSCLDRHVDSAGFIPCDSLPDYRACVIDEMSEHGNCTKSGLCSEGSAYYHAETTYMHSLRCEVEASDGGCLTALDEACWSSQIRENMINLNAFMTPETFCGLLDTYEECIEQTVNSDVTLSDGTVLVRPCQNQASSVEAFRDGILSSYNRTSCVSPGNHYWSHICPYMVATASTEQEMEHRISVELSLDADYDSVVGDNSETVINELKEQLALLLGIPVSKLQNIRISPGSIKVEFEIVTFVTSEANSTTSALSAGLPPLVINDQAYDATVSTVLAIESTITTTTTTTTEATATSEQGPANSTCSECNARLNSILNYNYEMVTGEGSAEYSTRVCGEFDSVESCFSTCSGSETTEIITSKRQLPTLKASWCSDECGFADAAYCYASADRDLCSHIVSSDFTECIQAAEARCGGYHMCSQQQRYATVEKMKQQLKCWDQDIQQTECRTDIEACLATSSALEGGNVMEALESGLWYDFIELNGGIALKDICKEIQLPINCLRSKDLSNCAESYDLGLEVVTDIEQVWLKMTTFVCQDNERMMTLEGKCEEVSSSSEGTTKSHKSAEVIEEESTVEVKSTTKPSHPHDHDHRDTKPGKAGSVSDSAAAGFITPAYLMLLIVTLVGIAL